MSELYPLKFETVLKEKVWEEMLLLTGIIKKLPGHFISAKVGNYPAVADNQSVINNGFLAGNNIEELIEVYMGDITGDSVYEKFGMSFPC